MADKMRDNSMLIVLASKEYPFTQGVNYPYHQDSNFYYLTGINQPQCILVMYKHKNHLHTELFMHIQTMQDIIWHGKQLTQSNVLVDYKIDAVQDIKHFAGAIINQLPDYDFCYLDKHRLADYGNSVMSAIQDNCQVEELNDSINKMRLIKDEYEIHSLTKAVEISSNAHILAMQSVYSTIYEHEVAGKFIGRCMELGALHQAYPPIVAGGERALGLHYTENNKQIKSGELMLIDAACEYNHYTADITRTYPVDGKFSREQAALYDLVLYAQQSAIEVIKPNTPYKLIHDTAVSCLVAGLIDLNILTGSLEDNIFKQTYKKFYPHSTGHWLGLDVHDVGNYTQSNSSTLLSANMLLTVEPGLYIYPDNQVDEKWHNIGIRIEDDVLVSSVGHEILSHTVPKMRTEVEKIINSNAKCTCVIGSGC